MKIISHAPCRIGLLGGGTDLDPYAKRYGGICLNMAINIRQHIKIDDTGNKQIIPEGANPKFYKTIFREMGMSESTELFADFDGLIESGLGSSASCAVALVGAINKLKGKNVGKQEVAEKAWDIEINKLGLFGGKQDQYAAALGGVNILEFGREVKVNSLSPSFVEELLPHLVLFYLGGNRKSPQIQENFKNPTDIQIRALDNIKEFALVGIDLLANKKIEEFGRLMDKIWVKKKLSNGGVNNELIDKYYERAQALGVWGGKVLGAGGGGHMLFVCPPEKKQKLRNHLGLEEIDFSLDQNGLDVRRI